MPNSIDERVVKMEFDNAKFEKNIKQSIKSLEQLDKTLEMKDATKGFEELEKAANSVDLSKLEKAADVIEKRFSGAGIAGAALINRAVNGTINLIGKLGSSVVGLAKSGGISRALKLEHANFMLNGLLKDASKVAEIMATDGPVQKSVRGTAYGLDAAANAAAQLVASGVTDMQKLENALTGVSGVAAMTSSEFEDISAVFTTVAGQGKVMTRQLRQIEARGLNAAAAIAEFLHTTEAEVREMVQHGEVSFDQFAEAMNYAFGDQAKKANETFTGAMSNVKAALSRIGAKVATPAIESIRKIFVALIDVVNDLNSALSKSILPRIEDFIKTKGAFIQRILESTKFLNIMEHAVKNLEAGFDALMSILKPIGRAFKNVFPSNLLDRIETLQNAFESFTNRITLTNREMAELQLIFEAIFDVVDVAVSTIQAVLKILIPGLDKVFDATDSLGSKILKIAAFFAYLIDYVHDFIKEVGLLRGAVTLVASLFGGSASTIAEIYNVLSNMPNVLETVAMVLAGVVVTIGDALYNLISYVSQLEIVQKTLETIKNAIIRIGNAAIPVLNAIGDAIIFVVNAGIDLANGNIPKIFDSITSAIKPAKAETSGFVSSAKELFGSFKKSKQLTDGVEKVVVASEKYMSSGNNIKVTNGVIVRSMDEVQTAAEETASNSESIIDRISRVFGRFNDLGALFAITFGAAIVTTIINIARVIDGFGRTIRSLRLIGDSIRMFFLTLTVNLRAFAIVEIAAAITMLAGSILLLAKLASPAELAVAIGAIAALGISLGIIAKVIGSINALQVMKLTTMAQVMIELSAALLICAAAVAKLESASKNWRGLLLSVGALIALMGGLAVVAGILGTIDNLNPISAAGSLIKFSGALYVAALALEKLGKVDLQTAYKAVPLLLSIMGGLAAIALASSLNLSPFSGLAMVGIVTSLLILLKALESLASIDTDVLDQTITIIDAIGKWIVKILEVVVIIKLLETATALFTYLTTKINGLGNLIKKLQISASKLMKMLGFASVFVGIAASLYIIVSAIKKIGEMDIKSLIQGSIVITALAVGIGMMIKQLMLLANEWELMTKNSASLYSAMTGLGMFLFLMAGSVAILANIPNDLIMQGLARLLAVEVLVAALITGLSIINSKLGPMVEVSIKSIGAVALLFGIMTAALAVLGLLPVDMFAQGIIGLIGITLMCVVLMTALASIGPMAVTATVAVYGLSVLLLAFGAVGLMLNNVDPNTLSANLETFLITIGILTLALAGLGVLVEFLGPGLAVAAGMVGILGSLAIVGQMIAAINSSAFPELAQNIVNACQILVFGIVNLATTLANPVTMLGFIVGCEALMGLGAALTFLIPPALGFAAAALGLGTGLALAGNGMTLLAGGLKLMESIDVETIVSALGSLIDYSLSMLSAVPGLIAFGVALIPFASGLSACSVAIMIFAAAMAILSSEGLVGHLIDNMSKLVSAAQLLSANLKELAYAAIGLSALGVGLVVLTAGVVSFSAAVLILSVALLAVVGVFYLFAEGISKIKDSVVSITEAVDLMAETLNKLGTNTVYDLYKALVDAANEVLPAAGTYMCELVAEGFENEINNSFKTAVDDTVEALRVYCEANASKVKNYAKTLGEAYDEGVRDPTNSYCINDHKELPEDTEESIAAGAKEAIPGIKQSATSMGDAYGKPLSQRIGDWLKGLVDKIRTWWDKIKQGDFLGAFGLDFSTTISSFTDGYEDKINSIMKTNEKMERYYRQTNGTTVTHSQYTDARNEGRKKLKEYLEGTKEESEVLGANTAAVDDNSKSKSKNKKANDKKTKAIKEETDTTEEETEAVEDNSQAIREMAEQIEVVTKEYNKLNHYQGLIAASNKRVRLGNDISAKFWNSTVKSLKDVANVSKEVSKSIPNMVNGAKQGLYKFGEGMKNTEKLYKAKNLKKSVSSITKYVEQSGNSVAKVMGNTLKVFYKSNGKVNSIYMNATKNLKAIPQKFKKAMDTIAFFNRNTSDMINKYDWSDDVISHLRMIEESFGRVKFSKLSGGIQDYLRGVLGKFEELNPAIRQISKSLGGTYTIFSKNSKVVAATADSLISLGAVLYNGSDAANEYATNLARLEFLAEHGEATWEEVEEARVGYLERIKNALLEYKQALDETYMKEVDFFSAFNKNALDENVNLMENLFSQISGYYTYGEMLTELSRRLPALGESTQLMKMFADAGVDSFGKLQKVLEMNQEELNAYIYGISVLNKTQEETSNKALAAMANATSYAAKRQQAVDKDVLQKTTKYSENVRKAIISDMEAVAQATVEYNKISKKEEKEYLKTLTAEEKKYYKQRKKYYKEAKKDYEKQKAAQEEKAYAKQLVENIKTFKDYLETLNKYAGDAKANASLTNMLASAFGDLVKNANNAGVALSVTDENLLRFADTLDSTGQDGLNYFEEMAARIQNLVNDIKGAITNVNILTAAFEKTAAIKFANIYDNILSNLIGGDNIISALSELATKGYNSAVLTKVKAVYDSNRSEGLELIKAMNKATAEEVKKTNTAMDALNTSAETEANTWIKILSSAGKTKEQLDTAASVALTNLTKATETRAAKEAEIAELEKQQAKTNSDISKLQKTIKKKGSTDARKTKLANLRAELSKNKAAIANARQELEALQRAEAAAQKAHNDAVAELNNYTAKLNINLETIKKDKAVKQWYETCIKAQKKLSEMVKETTNGSKEYIRILQVATEISKEFASTATQYNLEGLYKNIKGMADAAAPVQNIVDGLYNFGATLVDISDSIDNFDERCVKALTEYKNSLKDAIKQSSDFFNMFRGFADEDNPLQATDYLEYADSQINALKTWMENLEKLTDLGLDKELVEKLASQGLGSYEIVNAFAKATKAQIGEYNHQWKEYNDTIAKATESAFTDIAASWSTAGQALSESMIKYFGENGADRLKEAGYEASAMVITGVKDGLTEAMPSIISAVEHTDTSSMSKALGKSVGQGINTGLVEAISGSVNETVNTVIEKFKMAVDSVLAYATEVIPTDFTITVHVDTSEIDAAVARMNQVIYATNISANETSNAVDTSNANKEVVATVPTEPVGNTINLNYVQNNNSPKELDQVTIYRNTQNQLNAFKSVQELAGT